MKATRNSWLFPLSLLAIALPFTSITANGAKDDKKGKSNLIACDESLGGTMSSRSLLPPGELASIARRMQNYKINDRVTHRWRDSGGTPFMHARENPLAHWLAVRLILKELKERAEAKGLSREQLSSSGSPIPFFEEAFNDVVVGDAHYGNIGMLPFNGPRTGSSQQSRAPAPSLDDRSLHLVYNDIDDAGDGPLMGDWLRNAATSALMNHDVEALANGYIQGLTMPGLEPPGWVNDLLNMSMEDFSELQDERAQKLFQEGRFVKSGGTLSYDVPAAIVEFLVRAFTDTVRGREGRPIIAMFTKDSGGSGGIARYWVLREAFGGKRTVTEIKWITDKPGVMGFNPNQLPPGPRFLLVTAKMWHGLRSADLFQMDLDGAPYFVRPKYVNPIKRAVEKREEQGKDLDKWAAFSAALLGHNHRGSPHQADDLFAQYILSHRDSFYKASRGMVDAINFIFQVAREEKLGSPPQ